MFIVGLTGGIGVGKSTVAGLLGQRGAWVVDVDGLGRAIIAPGGRAVEAVVERFGEQVRGGDGGIDRAALASIVFGNEEELAALNAVSHPAINELLDEAVDQAVAERGPDTVVVFDMAVLFESTLGQDTRHPYEVVVTVEAPMPLRLERLEERGMTRDDAQARIESQASDEDRRARSQFIIGNGAGLDELDEAVERLWAEIERLHAAKYG